MSSKKQYNFAYHSVRILQVLSNTDGLNKSELRARAFNRVPRAVSDQWLDVMESKGQIRSQFQPTGKKGRPGLVFALGHNGRKCLQQKTLDLPPVRVP